MAVATVPVRPTIVEVATSEVDCCPYISRMIKYMNAPMIIPVPSPVNDERIICSQAYWAIAPPPPKPMMNVPITLVHEKMDTVGSLSWPPSWP